MRTPFRAAVEPTYTAANSGLIYRFNTNQTASDSIASAVPYLACRAVGYGGGRASSRPCCRAARLLNRMAAESQSRQRTAFQQHETLCANGAKQHVSTPHLSRVAGSGKIQPSSPCPTSVNFFTLYFQVDEFSDFVPSLSIQPYGSYPVDPTIWIASNPNDFLLLPFCFPRMYDL